MATSVEITFDGTKFYWKTRNTVDVVIAHHIAHKVFEVIVYEPTLDREAPRLYLNEEILMPKIDHNEVNSKLSFAKRNNVPLTEKLVQGIMNKAISDFILNRLVIQQLAALEKKFDVGIKIDDYDVMLSANFKDLVCSRPDGLVMHEAKHYKNLMQDAAVAILEALEEDKKELKEICEVAEEIEARVSPIVRDRWRMPLVLNKVFHGLRLGANDTKIFGKIKANLKTDEDVARMKSVMRSGAHNHPAVHSATPAKEAGSTLHHPHPVAEVSFNSHTHPHLPSHDVHSGAAKSPTHASHSDSGAAKSPTHASHSDSGAAKSPTHASHSDGGAAKSPTHASHHEPAAMERISSVPAGAAAIAQPEKNPCRTDHASASTASETSADLKSHASLTKKPVLGTRSGDLGSFLWNFASGLLGSAPAGTSPKKVVPAQ